MKRPVTPYDVARIAAMEGSVRELCHDLIDLPIIGGLLPESDETALIARFATAIKTLGALDRELRRNVW